MQIYTDCNKKIKTAKRFCDEPK